HAVDEAGVSREGEQLPAGLRVPDLHGPVPASRGQVRAGGAETDAADAARVPGEGEEFPSRVRVPQLHRVVPSGTGEAAAVAAEGDTEESVGVLAEGPLVTGEERQEVAVLPAAAVTARRAQVLHGEHEVVIVPGRLRQLQ